MTHKIGSTFKRYFPILVILLITLGLLLFSAPNSKNFASHPQPAANFDAAVRVIKELQLQEAEELNPVCVSKLLTHGKKVEHAIVFFHGFTNCPQQFAKLGQAFFDLGYNVYIPREPHHGLANRLTEDLKNLTAEELVRATDQSIDIAAGLGDKVTVAGLSGGGVMTAWAAQNRPEVAKALVIAPNFSIPGSPLLKRPATNLFAMLPNFFIWWDPKLKENIPGAPYFYPRYATRALAAFMRLGIAVEAQANRQAPKARQIVVITNANDMAVNNKVTESVMQAWQKSTANQVTSYQFPATMQLPHDIIDPENEAQTKVVYPILTNLIVAD